MDYNSALEFATKKHKGQTRKGGDEYITHPKAVSEILRDKGYSMAYEISGLFHDLLEDTNATEEEILNLSNDEVLQTVKLLTKYKGYNMNEYLSEIKKNKMAITVKLADRLHNLKCSVHADVKFIKKYIKETEEYYLDLCKDTSFEEEIKAALDKAKISIGLLNVK